MVNGDLQSTDVRFGDNLRAERHRRRLTQSDVGDAVGVAQSMVSCYERGVTVPDLLMAIDLAAAVGCELSALVAGRVMADAVGIGPQANAEGADPRAATRQSRSDRMSNRVSRNEVQ